MLGVEEELFFVDAETLEAAPGFSRVVGEGDERVKPEVFECLVELTTPPLPDAPAVLEYLSAARRDLAGRAAAHGLAIYAAGSHPTARGVDQEIVPRHRELVERIGPVMRKQLVCGLHVHVEVEDPLAALELVRPWLPRLLELSANSPFHSRREALLRMPTGGPPPPVPTWEVWRELTAGDPNRRHWDAWPRPEYGTIEVRVMDQQTDVRRSAGFAALVAAIVSETEFVSETELRERLDPLARLVLESPPEAALRLGPREIAARTLGFEA